MSKKGGAKGGSSKRDGGALYKGMALKLSDIVVGDTLGAFPHCQPATARGSFRSGTPPAAAKRERDWGERCITSVRGAGCAVVCCGVWWIMDIGAGFTSQGLHLTNLIVTPAATLL